jgi:hypothetical protein
LKAPGARPRRPGLTGRTFLGFDPSLEAGGPATNRPRDAKTPHVVNQPSSAHLRSFVKVQGQLTNEGRSVTNSSA